MNDQPKKEIPYGAIQAIASWAFIKSAAELAMPYNKVNDHNSKQVMQQISIAVLTSAVTGKKCTVITTPVLNDDGTVSGFECALDGEGIEALAKMKDKEIITALVPQLVNRCQQEPSGISDILSKIFGENESDDDEDVNDDDEVQDKSEQAAS